MGKCIWPFIAAMILGLTACSSAAPPSTLTEPYPPAQASQTAENTVTQMAQELAFAATQTASVRPSATLRPTDMFSGNQPTCFIDPSLGFSLIVEPGWFASPGYDGNSRVSSVTLYNYDYNAPDRANDIFSKGGMRVSLQFFDAQPVMSLDQYIEQRIKDAQFSSNNSLTITGPISYTLGAYSGMAFSASGGDPDFQEIILQSGNRLAIIGLMPSNSAALPQALTMLSTLDISGQAPCSP